MRPYKLRVFQKSFNGGEKIIAKTFRLLSFIIFFAAPLIIFGQATQRLAVQGKIVDENGDALQGVSVQIKGTQTGVISNESGNFSLTANSSADVLVFSFVGYQSQEIRIGSRRNFEVHLQSGTSGTLSDVVVVGYGTRRKADLTTAVGSVSGDQLSELPTTNNLVQGLAGKAAGVNVMVNSGKPGGQPIIRIRGLGSLNASNDPLYVVDGIVGVDPQTIDVTIVQSVDVLKDAAAASIYGSRGSNGVVVITTKSGRKDASSITLNNTVSFGSLARKLPLMNADENLKMWEMEYGYVPGRLPPHLDPGNNFPRKADLFNADGTPKYNTDWQKEATRTAVSHNHSLTFSGGGENMTAIANISVRDDQGLMLNSNAKRIDGFVKISWDVKPWLNIQSSLMSGGQKANAPEEAGGYPLGQTAIRRMYSALPFLPVQYPDGTYANEGDYPGAELAENPVRLLNSLFNQTTQTYQIGNIIGTFHLVKHLNFTSSFNGQLGATSHNYYASIGLAGISSTQHGIAQRTNGQSGSWTNENYFTYSNSFGDHSLEATVGASWYYYSSNSTFAGAENFFDDFFQYNSLQAGSVKEIPTSTVDESKFNSYYGRVHYSYKGRYLADVSYRADGSSRFGADHKYGFFPSFSGAWVVSQESFFENSNLRNTLSSLKLRASYGSVGNAEIPNYLSLAQLQNSVDIFNGTAASTVTLSSLANADLSWEKSHQYDLGIDLGFLNERIHLSADVYKKITNALLYTKNLPATTGYASAMSNIGSISNKGLEITINSENISTKDFTWNTTFNYTMNRNKVLNINGDIIYGTNTRLMEGRPLNEYFTYVRVGIWGTAEAAEAATYGARPGDVKYADLSGPDGKPDGKITSDDRAPLGTGTPKFETNMTNVFTYKNFVFQFDLGAMVGLKLYNLAEQFIMGPQDNVNGLKILLNSWTPDNQNTMLPQMRLLGDPSSNPLGNDSYLIENGSFLRIRNISLGYNLKSDWLKSKLIQNIAFRVDVQNAYLFTKYRGLDPEMNSFSNFRLQGLDMYAYPRPRTIAFSLNFTF